MGSGMLLHIRHLTEFHYARPIAGGKMKIRMTPSPDCGQDVQMRELKLSGCTLCSSFRDIFGNQVELVEVEGERQDISFEMCADVETRDLAGICGTDPQQSPAWAFKASTPKTNPGEAVGRIAANFADDDPQNPGTLHRLSDHVRAAVTYRIGSTSTETTAEEAALKGEGVCQDHAHIFISATRLLGLPARYVSGYLRMRDRIEQEAMHAWAEVFIDDLGWTGFDVSNGVAPDESHVRIAVGRDYSDAAPVTGVVRGGGNETMKVAICVSQISEVFPQNRSRQIK